MSDYTPNVEDVRACYCRCRVSTERDITADIHKGRAEFDRFIAKVKADALREAADEWRKHLLAASSSYVCAESWLKNRADWIESRDGQ